MGRIRVLEPGMFSTIQDLGRPGLSSLGICRGGAADPLSLRQGNRIVGNPDDAPALELTLTGPTLHFQADALIAISGSSDCQPISLKAGSHFKVGSFTGNARRYLCIRGGFTISPVLNSASTHISAGFGGYQGRALRQNDVLEFNDQTPPIKSTPFTSAPSTSLRTIRAVSGAHPHAFDQSATDLFWSTIFTVSNQSNRTGLRLEGPAIPTLITGRLISEGMPPGSIQIPESGKPIALGVDHPTTGGYPVIACIISTDLHILGQARPSDMLRFRQVTLEEATQAYKGLNAMLNLEAHS